MDGVKERLYVLVMAGDFALERGQRSGQLFMRGHELPKPVEGPDDLDAGGDRDGTVENRSEHDGAVLGEGVRQILPMFPVRQS